MKTKLLDRVLWVAILALPLAALLAPQPAQAQPREGWYKNIVDTDFVKQYVDIPPRIDEDHVLARRVNTTPATCRAQSTFPTRSSNR